MQTTQVPTWANQYSESTQAQIIALQGKGNSALSRARALENKAKDENRDLDAGELDFVDNQLDAFAKFQDEIEGFKSQGRKTKPQPIGGRTTDGKPGSFANLFGSTHENRQWNSLGEFARAVAVNDPRLFQNASGMGEVTSSQGGYYVPSQLLAGIIDGSLQAEAVRPRALVVAMSAPDLSIPMFNTETRSTGLAGLEPEKRAEGTTGTNQTASVKNVKLIANKLMILVPTTSELIEDAGPVFDQMLTRYMQESLSQALDDYFLNGSGVASPLGILNANCTVSVAKDSSQVAATVTPTNLSGMISRLAPGSFSKAVWLAHPSVLAQLFVMANVVKNVAGSENVGGFGPDWLTVAPDGTMSLLSRPLVVSDRCQQLGTVGDIILADLSQYVIGIRSDARLMIDPSVGFKEDEIYYRLTMRLDGQPLLANAITPRKGSSTLSPFVSLATR